MAQTVSAPDVDGNIHEINVSDLRWRPSAYGIVIRDSKLLVSPQFDGYDLPGGGVHLGELPEEGVIREVKEETGIDVANPRPVTFASNYFVLPASAQGANVQSILMYFVCDFAGGELSDAGFDEAEKVYSRFPEWLPIENLDNIKLASSVDWRPIVKQALKV